jgi:hypothetical protein
MIYLKVSLSDFLTVFTARTQSWFWTRKPGKALLTAAVIAMVIATLLSFFWFLNVEGDFGDIPDMGCSAIHLDI